MYVSLKLLLFHSPVSIAYFEITVSLINNLDINLFVLRKQNITFLRKLILLFKIVVTI